MTAEGALLIAVAGLLVIAGATALAPRARLAAPLLLVLLGAGVSALPITPAIDVEPEWILVGVLPPLLHSAAVSMPTMDLRRELGAIGGLSVVLVLLSTAAVGGLAALLLPDLPLPWAFALGAVVSPTDAVATSIVRRLGVAPRVVTLLEGEGLLNDATALVLLRSAVAAAAASVSVGGVVVDFLYAVVAAVVIGVLVGRVVLALRARTSEATVSTVLSFTVPFLASVPAEQAGASGLVAAVAAGVVTSRRAAAALPPQHRLSDQQNWRTIELVLEGAIFLLLGLELRTLLEDVAASGSGVVSALAVAAALLATTVLVRAAYVAGLLALLGLQGARSARVRGGVAEMVAHPAEAAARFQARRPGRPRPLSDRQFERFRTRARRVLNDIDHLLATPLGPRDGAVVVWAGMRGAVTLAAAQTLPEDAAQRSVLVFVAFAVAAGSLLLQGATLPWVVRAVGPAAASATSTADDEAAITALLAEARAAVDAAPTGDMTADLLAVLDAQRRALLHARDEGLFASQPLEAALAVLDADQVRLELRGAPAR